MIEDLGELEKHREAFFVCETVVSLVFVTEKSAYVRMK